MGALDGSSSFLGARFANRFDIEAPVGAGGMGVVYRAADQHTGKRVALKVLHESLKSGHEVARFRREAQILSELNHPHIVGAVAHGETPDGRRYLAMEWLDGHDLAHHLQKGPLSLTSALHLIERVTAGLAAAHGRGIVHRVLPSH
jgi:serine/threonine protein kinase